MAVLKEKLNFDTAQFSCLFYVMYALTFTTEYLYFQNIQKMLGLAPSRAATKQAGGFLGPPPQAAKFS